MQQFWALVVFAAVAAFTPGPNNTMLMVSGANWGFGASVPHMLGVTIGFPVMIFLIGMGIGGTLEAHPLLHQTMKFVAFAYMLYLAWKIARAGRPDPEGGREGRPMTFIGAALFQWVNPKAWIMAVGALALFVSPVEAALPAVIGIALVFAATALPSTVVWCLFGTAISRHLDSDRRVAIFNGAMALILVVSMIPTLL